MLLLLSVLLLRVCHCRKSYCRKRKQADGTTSSMEEAAHKVAMGNAILV